MSRFKLSVGSPGRAMFCRSMLAVAITAGVAIAPLAARNSDPDAGVDTSALTDAERVFLQDEDSLNLLGMSSYNFGKSLQGRPADEVAAAVRALTGALIDAHYKEGPDSNITAGEITDLSAPRGDWAAIPLGIDAPNAGAGRQERPRELEKIQRDPGVFSLKQYFGQLGGVPTFNNAPVALRTDDIVASAVEVTFVGIPADNGSGWRDAVNAPDAMRSRFMNYATSGYDIYLDVDATKALTLADWGNIGIDKMSPELSVDRARTTLSQIAATGTIPFIIGGDSSVRYVSVGALADQYGKGAFTVVQLGAHPDSLRDLDHTITDEQAVSALIRDGLLDGNDLIQVGVRSSQIRPGDLQWLRTQGVKAHTMADVETRSWATVFRDVLNAVRRARKGVFVSFDMSVLDPSQGTAIGRPVVNGLTVREVAPLVRSLCSQNDVVGFEILDVTPYLDLSYQSAYTANYVMNSCLAGVAQRRSIVARRN